MNIKKRHFFEIVSVLKKLHGFGSTRFFSIILSRYIRTSFTHLDKIESNVHKIPYDTIEYRKMLTGKEGMIRWTKVKNEFNNFYKSSTILNTFKVYDKNLFSDHFSRKIKYNHFIFNKYYLKKHKTKRTELHNIIEESNLDIKVKLILKYIPEVYVEYFQSIYSLIKRSGQNENHIYHVTSGLKDYMHEYIIAYSVLNGSNLYMYQHGGFYGEIKHHYQTDIERYISDKFITWGWSLKGKDHPYGSIQLKKFSESYKSLNGNVKYDILVPLPFSADEDSIYIDLNKIIEHTDKKICIRKRKNLIGNETVSVLPNGIVRSKVVEIDDGNRPILESIKSTKIVLMLNHPSTTFLECLSVNHPVLVFCPNLKYDDLNDGYVENIKSLLDLKMFHMDINSLISFIQNTDINEWWDNIIKSKCYNNFKNTYAKKIS